MLVIAFLTMYITVISGSLYRCDFTDKYHIILFYEWMVNLPYCELYLSNISCNENAVAIRSVFFLSALYPSNYLSVLLS